MEDQSPNKRKHIRMRLVSSVKYKYADLLVQQVDEEELRVTRDAQSADISLSGIQLLTDDTVKVGAILKMDIDLPGQQVPITTFGIVEWCRKDENVIGVYRIGVNFTVVDPDHTQLIKNFVGEK